MNLFIVLAPARITSFSDTLIYPQGNKLDLFPEIRETDISAPHLSWLHNGKVLHSSDKYRITEDGTLVINHLMEDIDKVVCHVNNIYGEDHIEYKVGVVKPPLAPTLKVRKITDSLISLSWNLPHNGGALLQGL